MSLPSASYSITMRLRYPNEIGTFSHVAAAIADAGGDVGAIDIVRAGLEAFADAVAERRPFLIPPADIVNGVAVLEAIEKSSAKNRALPIA